MVETGLPTSSSRYDPSNRAQADRAVQAIVPHRNFITVKVSTDDLEAASTFVPYIRIRTTSGYTATVNLDSGHLSLMRGEDILEPEQFNPEEYIQLVKQKLNEASAYLPCPPSFSAINTLDLDKNQVDAHAVGADSLLAAIRKMDGSQLRLLKGLRAGAIVVLDLTALAGHPSDRIAQRLTDLSQNIGIASGDSRFVYPLKELLKNAVSHGNKMDLTLPVYLHYDREGSSIRVIDLARQGEVPKVSASLTGEHVGTRLAALHGTYTLDEKPKDRFSQPSGPTVATFSLKQPGTSAPR